MAKTGNYPKPLNLGILIFRLGAPVEKQGIPHKDHTKDKEENPEIVPHVGKDPEVGKE
jgi:hypothetical protein